MSLSVIVTSYRSSRILEDCLASLTAQQAAGEIVVADCSPDDPTALLRGRFPRVRVLHFSEKKTVPALRWSAVSETRGDLVAAMEARCVPSADWCARLVRAHGQHPDAPAVGGPVALKADASPFDWGLYFCEFGLFTPGAHEGRVAQLSGANLSYKRTALDECGDLMAAGHWEASLHERWLRDGRPLQMSGATVEFRNGMAVADAFRMRFHYGRSYAADRFEGERLEPLLYLALVPALPLLLTWRVGRTAWRRNLGRPFLRALPWVVAFNAAWAAGEWTGYLLGRSSRPHIY